MGEQIFEFAKRPDVKIIVEIGTWNGLGTTKCIYDGILHGRKKDFLVLSLECNRMRYEEANTNLLPLNNFNIVHGSIVTVEELLAANEKQRTHPWFIEDLRHIKTAPYIFHEIPEKIDLLVLDGGEFSSLIEFEKLWERSRFIILDDTTTNKNTEVRNFILSKPEKIKIIEDNLKDRNGFMICENLI